MKYIYLETFGCTANQNNSEILKGILKQSGYEITNNQEIADIIILNTCVVKGKTENKIKRRIQDLAKGNKLLIVAGCMPKTDAKAIKKLNSGSILLGTHHFRDIVKLIRDYQDNKLKDKKYLDNSDEIKLLLPKIPKNKLISITQISEGCLGGCSYCKTRLAKGKLFSYPMEDIIKSIENDLKQGAKEIWITSQDNANYGLDKGSQKLPGLLNKILNLNHRFKLRLGMMDPNNVFLILDELVEIYKNKKMYKFLHVPIQSASNKILKDMNRLYTIEQVEEIIRKFRQKIPKVVISTDIIVGYPTSKEGDFQKNFGFIKKIKPDVFNLSKFSSHKATKAGKLKQLAPKIIHKRAKELMDEHRETALENKKKFLNEEFKVFVNRKLGGDLYESRDENYNIVLINSSEKILGKNVKIRVKDVGVHHMFGEVKS